MSSRPSSPPDIAASCRDAVVAAELRKAQNMKVLELSEISSLADYFLICTGTSERQVRAIADGVVETLKAESLRPHHIEGYNLGHWVLIDYGDFVVHVFDEETRSFYGLEKLWADAPDVTPDFAR